MISAIVSLVGSGLLKRERLRGIAIVAIPILTTLARRIRIDPDKSQPFFLLYDAYDGNSYF
jgi:hypothetical protein